MSPFFLGDESKSGSKRLAKRIERAIFEDLRARKLKGELTRAQVAQEVDVLLGYDPRRSNWTEPIERWKIQEIDGKRTIEPISVNVAKCESSGFSWLTNFAGDSRTSTGPAFLSAFLKSSAETVRSGLVKVF